MADFQWQDGSDSEESWEFQELGQGEEHEKFGQPIEAPPPPPQISVQLSRRAKLLSIGAAVFITIIASIAGAANLRVNRITNQLTQEVLTSHSLLETAYADDDLELFISLLSGSNKTWADTQIDLFQQGVYRSAFLYSLMLAPPASSDTIRVELAADLNSAIVFTTNQYQNGQGEILQFEQTYLYKPGPNRWLLTPTPLPLSADTNVWSSFSDFDPMRGDRLQSSYDQSEEEIVQAIRSEIDPILSTLCDTHVGLCLFNPQVHFDYNDSNLLNSTFSANIPLPTQNTADSAPETAAASNGSHQFPAPSLFGRPLDEQTRQRLVDQYVRAMTHAYLADQLLANCCPENRRYMKDLLVQEALAQAGLIPSPLSEVDVSADLINTISATTLDYGISDASDELLLHYLLDHQDASLGEISWLLQDEERSFTDLLAFYQLSNNALLKELYELNPTSLTHTHLSQDIVTICESPDGGENSIEFRYDHDQEAWSDSTRYDQWGSLHIMADDQGKLISLNSTHEVLPQTVVYAPNASESFEIFQSRFRAAGQAPTPPYLNRDRHFSLQSTHQSALPSFYEFSTDQCTADSCPHANANFVPHWSSDNTHYLYSFRDDLYLANAFTGEEIDLDVETDMMAWYDDSRFIYTEKTAPQSITQTVQMRTINSTETKALFSWPTLLEEPLTKLGYSWPSYDQITHLTFLPEQNDILLIETTAQPDASEGGGLFFIEWQTAKLKFFIPHDSQFGTHRFSPDNRWLLWEGASPNRSYLFDLTTQTLAQSYPAPQNSPHAGTLYNSFDWSADSRWLLHFTNNAVAIVDPIELTYDPIPYPDEIAACRGGGFINPSP